MRSRATTGDAGILTVAPASAGRRAHRIPAIRAASVICTIVAIICSGEARGEDAVAAPASLVTARRHAFVRSFAFGWLLQRRCGARTLAAAALVLALNAPWFLVPLS